MAVLGYDLNTQEKILLSILCVLTQLIVFLNYFLVRTNSTEISNMNIENCMAPAKLGGLKKSPKSSTELSSGSSGSPRRLLEPIL